MMVADSDVLIDYLRGDPRSAGRIRLELSTGRLCTTAINAFELLSGAKRSGDETAVATLLAAMKVLSVDAEAAVLAASVRRGLEAAGQGIGTADYLIAGICLARGAILLTQNRKHFERVPGLRLGSTAQSGAAEL